ncbi:putative drug exporter of the RND superfamily [Frankia sp. AiPs1]|uniref:MMPL family transporter n=1 Tax=Frankia sp. AiPa1 TaxID=573492 RepID=UPI00202B6A75|nr:MMPL family transporter [Frankia sp. AiPa1]MCL9760142.1 MMPL family transporter [Frankia sp. AiPa1]
MVLLVRWCQRYRWLVIAMWLTSLVATLALALHVGAKYSLELAGPDAESEQANKVAGALLPSGSLPDLETVVVRARTGTVQSPTVRARIAAMLSQISTVPGVAAPFDPYSPAAEVPLGQSPLSADGRTAIVSVLMKGKAIEPDHAAINGLIDAARAYDGPDIQVEVAGPGTTIVTQAGISTWPILLAVGVALLVLAMTLRAPAAVAVCMVVAVAAAGVSLALAMLLSRHASVNSLAPLLTLVLAFGMTLGSGVVVVHRTQTELRAGLDPPQAARSALRHPGRATVVGSLGLAAVMLATSALRLSVLDGLALAGFVSAMVSVLAVVTLVPAALRLTGRGLLVWTERTHLRQSGIGLPVRRGLHFWWAKAVARYPQVLAGLAVLVLVVLALPAAGLKLGGGDNGTDRTTTTTRRAYDVISQEYYPGLNGPMLAVVTGLRAGQPDPIPGVIKAIERTPGVRHAFPSLRNDKAGGAVIQVLPADGPRASGATALVHRLREQTVPALAAGSGLTIRIGGQAAIYDDMASGFSHAVPAFLALELLVLGLTAVFALRSVRHGLAVMAASLLALAATLGVITAVFTDGRFATRLGIRSSPVEPFLLGIILIVVFGLAIGMHLTMLSSLRSASAAVDQRRAISTRQADVGHATMTTSMVMVAVFSALTAQDLRIMKLLGIGLSVGVVLDALVVRVLLLPALLHLIRPGRSSRQAGHGGRSNRMAGVRTAAAQGMGAAVGLGASMTAGGAQADNDATAAARTVGIRRRNGAARRRGAPARDSARLVVHMGARGDGVSAPATSTMTMPVARRTGSRGAGTAGTAPASAGVAGGAGSAQPARVVGLRRVPASGLATTEVTRRGGRNGPGAPGVGPSDSGRGRRSGR